jgi:anti-sigma28 factor (negative regulator of flagellin synthesis)
MKIRDNKDRAEEVLRTLNQQHVQIQPRAKGQGAIGARGGLVDDIKIDVTLGRAVNEELNPESLLAERQARVEHLKKLIQEGKYSVPSESIAQALGQEITMEILSSPGGGSDDGEKESGQ